MAKLMSSIQVTRSPPVLAVLALLTHLILHQSEWDNHLHIWIVIWLLGLGSIATVECIQDPRFHSISTVVKVTTTAAVWYFGVLTASTLTHRVLFHRLRKVISLHHVSSQQG